MVSLICKTNSLNKYSFFLSNPSGFLFRFADTGFKNKWTGFWNAGTKFVEFFDFRLEEEFLGENNCFSLEYDFLKALHFHELRNGMQITQKLWMPRDKPFFVIELSSKKEIEAEFELAVNMRLVHENMHERKYCVKEGKHLVVESDLGKLIVSGLKGKAFFQHNPEYRTHFPGNEQQCYFVPGIFRLSGKRIALQVSAKKSFKLKKNELLHKYKRLKKISSSIKTDNKELNRQIQFAVSAIELLRGKHSFIAGLPWFQQYWARDVFWSMPAFTQLGLFEQCKHSLSFFAKHSLNGQIPNFVFGSEKTYNSIDSTPLFLIALDYFARFSNDQLFLKKMAKQAVQCIEFLESRRDENDGFLVHDKTSNETWMDSLNRPDKAIEVQALYISSLRAFSSLVSGLKGPRSKLKEKAVWAELEAMQLSKKFDKAFYQDGFFIDRICSNKKDKTRRINALVPLFLGLSDRKDVLKAFESEEFLTEKGITSLSRFDQNFSDESYHAGKIWSLGNAWLCGAEFAFGSIENSWRFFDLLCADFNEDALGCIGECWNPITLQQTGCLDQLWANAMIIRLFNEFALGLRVNANTKTISLKPKLGERASTIKMRIRLGSKEGLLKFNPKASSARFSLNGFRTELL